MVKTITSRPILLTSHQPFKPRFSLRTNMAWTLAGYGVYTICQWGMLVALAKIGSPEMVGQFALGLAITAPVMMFASLKMRIIQATDARNEFQFGDYLGVRILTTGCALLVVTVIAFIAHIARETVLVVLAIGLAKSFESVSDIFHGLFQFNERMDRVAVSLIIKGPLSLVVLVVIVFTTKSVMWGSIGLAISWALILFFYDIRFGNLMLKENLSQNISSIEFKLRRRALFPSWNWKGLRKLLRIGIPLGFVVTLNSLDTNIPRYFIEGYQGSAAIGIYAALAYFDRVGSTVVKALGESASPRMARNYAVKNSKGFSVLFIELIGLGFFLGLAGILVALIAGRQVLTLFYSAEYAQLDVFISLMIASGIGYISSFLIYGISAARIFNIQLVLSFIVTGSLIAMCYLIIPNNGLLGAANALVVSRIIQLIGCVIIAIIAIIKLQTSSTFPAS